MDISEKEIIRFITEYITEIKKIVENKRQEIEKVGYTPNFPTKFPVKTIVYFRRRGILINFEESESFSIVFNRSEEPHAKKSKWQKFIFHSKFTKNKEKASEIAKYDINDFLDIPRKVEEHEKDMQEQYEALFIEAQNFELDNYLEYLESAKKALNETRDSNPQELLDIKTTIQNHLSNYEYMIIVGGIALDSLHFMINSDLETSLFLALNGKYHSAMAILRKVLEVNVRCIYFDSLADKTSSQNKIDEWLNGGSFPLNFAVIVKALMMNINQQLTSLLKRVRLFEESSFKQFIISLYKSFHVYVHLRPQTADQDLDLYFSEYKPNEWKKYHDSFTQVTKLIETLLIIKFPKMVSTQGIGKETNDYKSLQLSKQQIEELSKFPSLIQ